MLFVLGLCSTFLCSCKKQEKITTDCFSDVTTVRQIINKPATIRMQPNGNFFIIEQGTIDTKLNPCNLPADFQIDNLNVTLSGNVKFTILNGTFACCTENFVVTKISR